MNDERYYRHSGTVPVSGFALMLIGGFVAALVMSIVYAMICWYNPFIYLTFIATCLLGAGVGWTLRTIATWTKVRSGMASGTAGLLCGIATVYLAWVTFFFLLTEFNFLIVTPGALGSLITALGEEGLWEVAGIAPAGWGLYAIWMIEAIAVTAFAVVVAMSNDAPFCVSCDRWIDTRDEKVQLRYDGGRDELKRDLEAENYRVLDELAAGEHNPYDYLDVLVKTCPTCSESNYISINRMIITPSNSGDDNVSTNPVVTNLSVPTTVIDQLYAYGDQQFDESDYTSLTDEEDEEDEPDHAADEHFSDEHEPIG